MRGHAHHVTSDGLDFVAEAVLEVELSVED